ncbi:MAG: hypothetical protein KF757_07965 [Phycisphaeraceae bacterium]|nr:hypothetical protein [Phycisphaeraceae bacterium]MCW5762690.1 hypothetical protein [Phycisphaeraceae bacterium]
MLSSKSASIALALALGTLGGCSADPSKGYSWTSTYSRDIASVSVPIFKNETFATGLETQLTDSVIKEIQRTTPWVVTPDRSADTTILGTITNIEFSRLTATPGTGLVLEQVVSIEIDFDWIDNRTGTPRVSRERMRAATIFVPTRTTGERAETGQRDAVAELSRALVAELRSNW